MCACVGATIVDSNYRTYMCVYIFVWLSTNIQIKRGMSPVHVHEKRCYTLTAHTRKINAKRQLKWTETNGLYTLRGTLGTGSVQHCSGDIYTAHYLVRMQGWPSMGVKSVKMLASFISPAHTVAAPSPVCVRVCARSCIFSHLRAFTHCMCACAHTNSHPSTPSYSHDMRDAGVLAMVRWLLSFAQMRHSSTAHRLLKNTKIRKSMNLNYVSA